MVTYGEGGFTVKFSTLTNSIIVVIKVFWYLITMYNQGIVVFDTKVQSRYQGICCEGFVTDTKIVV